MPCAARSYTAVLVRGHSLALVGLLAVAAFVPPSLSAAGPELSTVRGAAPAVTPADDILGSLEDTPAPRRRADQLSKLGVERWHAAGSRGRGVKVAVLDSGFRGYRDHLGKALPAQVTARSFRHDHDLEARDSQHGILCGEVVHALAPDAELLLANWEADDPKTFLAAVRWAREEGAQVITCSVIMPSWSDGEGGGPVHEALTRLLGPGDKPGDVLFFASAGNVAQRHWSGPFHDADGDGYHEWQGAAADNVVTPWGRERVSVELNCRPGPQYDLAVYEEETSAEVGHALVGDRAEPGHAVVRFQPRPFRNYRVRVRLVKGAAQPFHLVSLGAGLSCSSAPGSIPFPADGPEVIAVGSVGKDGARLSYSSCGPNSSRPKPDFMAAVPFPSLWRPKPFGGTSAASPQVAALAALCWSRQLQATAAQVHTFLQTSARDLAKPGHDFETGYGLATLPAPERFAPLRKTLARAGESK